MDIKLKTELFQLISDVNRRLAEIDSISDTREKTKVYNEYIKLIENKSIEIKTRIKNGGRNEQKTKKN